MVLNWPAVIEGISHFKIGSSTEPVCAAENVSVDAEKINAAQITAGSHARIQRGIVYFDMRARTSESSGARRGLRHGCGSGTITPSGNLEIHA